MLAGPCKIIFRKVKTADNAFLNREVIRSERERERKRFLRGSRSLWNEGSRETLPSTHSHLSPIDNSCQVLILSHQKIFLSSDTCAGFPPWDTTPNKHLSLKTISITTTKMSTRVYRSQAEDFQQRQEQLQVVFSFLKQNVYSKISTIQE